MGRTFGSETLVDPLQCDFHVLYESDQSLTSISTTERPACWDSTLLSSKKGSYKWLLAKQSRDETKCSRMPGFMIRFKMFRTRGLF